MGLDVSNPIYINQRGIRGYSMLANIFLLNIYIFLLSLLVLQDFKGCELRGSWVKGESGGFSPHIHCVLVSWPPGGGPHLFVELPQVLLRGVGVLLVVKVLVVVHVSAHLLLVVHWTLWTTAHQSVQLRFTNAGRWQLRSRDTGLARESV